MRSSTAGSVAGQIAFFDQVSSRSSLQPCSSSVPSTRRPVELARNRPRCTFASTFPFAFASPGAHAPLWKPTSRA
ncbi:MAG: hypothetical protein L0323_23105 [Planctomycetes bacterium]|nr:hypothetical protein [Planctomycetota bacterium]